MSGFQLIKEVYMTKKLLNILFIVLKVAIILFLAFVGALLIHFANDEFILGLGNEALTAVVTMPLYVQIFSLALLLLALWYLLFSKKCSTKDWLLRGAFLIAASLLFLLSQHSVCDSARKAQITDVWLLKHSQPVSYNKADGPIDFRYSRSPFSLTIENPEGERAVIFLGVYPFRLDADKIIDFIDY